MNYPRAALDRRRFENQRRRFPDCPNPTMIFSWLLTRSNGKVRCALAKEFRAELVVARNDRTVVPESLCTCVFGYAQVAKAIGLGVSESDSRLCDTALSMAVPSCEVMEREKLRAWESFSVGGNCRGYGRLGARTRPSGYTILAKTV